MSLLTEAGFIAIEHAGETGFYTSKYTVGALFRAIKPLRRDDLDQACRLRAIKSH